MAAETSIKLTYEDYLAIPDDGRRHEIIDGEYYVSPSPSFKHQIAILRLASALETHVRTNGLGYVIPAPFDVVLSQHDVVQPDIVYVSRERQQAITKGNLQSAPDLAVEVLSPSNHDYDEHVKYKVYEKSGVLEYWIVDPEAESVKIFRRTNDSFTAIPVTDNLNTPLLPGFALPIAELFV